MVPGDQVIAADGRIGHDHIGQAEFMAFGSNAAKMEIRIIDGSKHRILADLTIVPEHFPGSFILGFAQFGPGKQSSIVTNILCSEIPGIIAMDGQRYGIAQERDIQGGIFSDDFQDIKIILQQRTWRAGKRVVDSRSIVGAVGVPGIALDVLEVKIGNSDNTKIWMIFNICPPRLITIILIHVKRMLSQC